MKDVDKIALNSNIHGRRKPHAAKSRADQNNDLQYTGILASFGTCPCSVDQVYSLGINMQYYIGDIYLEIDKLSRRKAKNNYKILAYKQLDGKDEIQKLAGINLNRLLTYFYNNGGPVIEAPVSTQMAREIQPFFSRLLTNLLKQLDCIVGMAVKNNISSGELEHMINVRIADLYTTMSMLFPVDDMKVAFHELIRVRENISNNM